MSTEEQLARALGWRKLDAKGEWMRPWGENGGIREYSLPKLDWTSVPLVLAEIERRHWLLKIETAWWAARLNSYSVYIEQAPGRITEIEEQDFPTAIISAFLAAVASEGERQ